MYLFWNKWIRIRITSTKFDKLSKYNQFSEFTIIVSETFHWIIIRYMWV